MAALSPLSTHPQIRHRGLLAKLHLLQQLHHITQQELLLSDVNQLPRLAAQKEALFERLRATDRRLALRPPPSAHQQHAKPVLQQLVQAIVTNNAKIEQTILAERRQLLKEMQILVSHHKLQTHLQREAVQKQGGKGSLVCIKH